MAELEELIEGYRAFAATVTLSMPVDRQARHRLLKRTLKVVGPVPDEQPTHFDPGDQETKRASPGNESQREALTPWRGHED
jgi:hypothetical protein